LDETIFGGAFQPPPLSGSEITVTLKTLKIQGFGILGTGRTLRAQYGPNANEAERSAWSSLSMLAVSTYIQD